MEQNALKNVKKLSKYQNLLLETSGGRSQIYI
jgi:hypothetical protein